MMDAERIREIAQTAVTYGQCGTRGIFVADIENAITQAVNEALESAAKLFDAEADKYEETCGESAAMCRSDAARVRALKPAVRGKG